MEEQDYTDRTHLRNLLRQHPEWTTTQYMAVTGRSRSWVKKWRKRIQEAPPGDDEVLQGRSRARKTAPARIAQPVVERILAIRDHPPANLQRIPGPKAIIYYLQQDTTLRAQGWHLPTSTSTIWRILVQHGRIARSSTGEHNPFERPAPMTSWQVDFKDVSSVPADPEGKRQHAVETFNIVDVGTSVVLDAVVRDDFNSETAIATMAQVFTSYGLPEKVTFDRDPRFVGSWSGRDFPAPFVRYLLCLGIAAQVCPPQRPDLNAFVERYHRSYQEECLAIHQPRTQTAAQTVTQAYVHHYNYERPNQALTCNNQPPRRAFPDLPQRPSLPLFVDPDRWLQVVNGQRYRRRVSSQGTIKLDNQAYYVKQSMRGQYVTVVVDATQQQLVVEHKKQPIKRIPIKGLYGELLSFESYLDAIRQEARLNWCRLMSQRKLVTMYSNS